MRHLRPAILFLVALLALATLLLAAAAYTIILKDGSSLIAKQKYTVQNGRAIIVLLNGTETFVALDKIDIPRTDAANRGGLGTGVLIPGSPQDVGTVPAQIPRDQTLGDLINKKGAGPREVPGTKRDKDQAAAGRLMKTKAGYNDFSALARRPFPHADLTAALQQFFRGQGVEDVEIFEGTAGDHPLVEISANSEGSVFKALNSAAAGLLQIRASFPGRVAAFDVLLTTQSRERAGQFVLTPEMAAELAAKKVEVAAFFVKNVQF
jgi:hypothetical protein